MKFLTFLFFFFLIIPAIAQETGVAGAWVSDADDSKTVVLIKDDYVSITSFTSTSFKDARGGTVKVDGDKMFIRQEFNTARKDLENEVLQVKLSGDRMKLGETSYERIDDGEAPLAGTWHITGRFQDGNMQQIHQQGTRKTLKMLTGNRFQWFAIDPDGNKFLGTGGGNYTFSNGTYTENIEFFSRDASRVGAALSFEGKIEDGKWHHSGLSSKGQPINEVWERIAD